MTPEFAVDLVRNAMFQAAALVAPLLLTAMAIGLCVSLIQAVTTIHEQTLTFVPKALAVLMMLVIVLPWMLRSVIDFSTRIIEKMPVMTQ